MVREILLIKTLPYDSDPDDCCRSFAFSFRTMDIVQPYTSYCQHYLYIW